MAQPAPIHAIYTWAGQVAGEPVAASGHQHVEQPEGHAGPFDGKAAVAGSNPGGDGGGDGLGSRIVERGVVAKQKRGADAFEMLAFGLVIAAELAAGKRGLVGRDRKQPAAERGSQAAQGTHAIDTSR
jgi:hypothetical protein